MNQDHSKSYLGIVVMLGAVWGLSEAGLGMWLRSCASFLSGSLMTGAALFFIAAAWFASRRILGVALLIVIACLFKLFDALLLSLPIQHGAIGNPMFAFLMEGLAFLVLLALYTEKQKHRTGRQAILGGMSALLAVNLFPLVKYATGVPACVFPGTTMPLSLYYAPVAVVLSSLTVPLGIWAASKMTTLETRLDEAHSVKKLRLIVSPAALLLCLVIITLIRLI